VNALSPCPSPAAGEGCLERIASFAAPTLQEPSRLRHPSPAAGEGQGERAC
jgi:hypothetical protein